MKNCLDMSTVIISRGRSNSISSHKLFNRAFLVVPDSEKTLYKHCGLQIVSIPDNIIGLGKVRNWVIDTFESEIIVMADDDIESFAYLSRLEYKRIVDCEYISHLLANSALMSYDMGVRIFGYNQCGPDVRKYNEPFSLSCWVGGVIGVIGKKHKFIENDFKVDIDFCLSALLEDRIIFRDNRYSIVQKMNKNKGGNSIYRTKESVDKEICFLKNKWGSHIDFKTTKKGEKCKINVKRRNNY